MAERKAAEPCELAFGEGFVLADASEVALEDYARVLTSSLRAEAVRGGPEEAIIAVRLFGPSAAPSAAERQDVEDFARGLALQGAGSGLGWA